MSSITATEHARPEPYVSAGSSPPASSAGDTRPGPRVEDDAAFVPGFAGLRCRACGTPADTGPVFVCTRCFGPLEATYDLERLAGTLTRSTFEDRVPSMWRYAELLPLDTLPTGGLTVGPSPLTWAPRLAARLGLDALWVKDDSRNPTLSFKDRVVGVAAARAAEFGFHTLACASTGNLAGAVAAAAAAWGLRAVVFVPADLEAAKISQAEALGASVVRVEGPYDDVNRLCLELTDELDGWGVVNVNLRPFYVEGSKTLAFEIAEQLGWRTPDVVVAPLASGSLYTKLDKGFGEFRAAGLLDSTARPRYIGGQAAGCGPIATAFAEDSDVVRPVRAPSTLVRSLAIGSPADGGKALDVARTSGGAILGVDDAETVSAMRLLAETEGILTETAGGVTLAALRRAVANGAVRPSDETVLVITGNGLKTLDILDRPATRSIAPTFEAFESWWEEHEERTAEAA
jgi:threonine synthase